MPELGFSNPIRFQVLDYSNKRQTIQNTFGMTVTDSNYDDVVDAVADLQTALDGIILGVISKAGWGVDEVITNNKPSNKQAQLETRITVSMRDNVTQAPFSFIIPTADYDAFNYGTGDAGDEIIISGAGASAATLAFVTAANTVLKSPFDPANAAIVTGMRIIR